MRCGLKTRLLFKRLMVMLMPIVLTSVIFLAPVISACSPLSPSVPVTKTPVATVSSAVTLNRADFKSDVIYQVVLDRFFDGDPKNNDPPGDTGLYDATRTNWKEYWGGDLAGLTQKIPYIAGMGVSAIWLSPVVENVHKLVNGTDAGYHGYWARDFYRIDPHLGTWANFDTLVSTAHASGIKVIIDFAANHSNPDNTGEFGSIYKDGVYQAAYNNDPNNWFHHNGTMTNADDQYNAEYYNLADLADFAQENPAVDSYLKGAMQVFLNHHIDGIRLDAVKHMPGPTGGWLRTFNDTIEAQGPHYTVGEWSLGDTNDPTYHSAVRFANQSGNAILNFPLYVALDNVYALGHSARELDGMISQEEHDFTWLNDQANFLDNHDKQRFLTLNKSKDALHQGLTVTMAAPGIPIIYYGTEWQLQRLPSWSAYWWNRHSYQGRHTWSGRPIHAWQESSCCLAVHTI
jgi:glycosidase